MTGITDAVDAVQEVAAEVTPVPATFDRVATAAEVKARLDWGEPALTIIDVRDRESFNNERIMGAVSMPLSELTDRIELESNRDIYVYGASESETAGAATQLEGAGFERVSAIEGGLSAWKAAGGPTEGRNA
ncbi:MAG: rhodanese-like domain-containing protein [Leptolyngbya sp. SIO4C1]|nr:rhodanese-like domain-containing protein [Leptolyngbya sp. SIO4C1]